MRLSDYLHGKFVVSDLRGRDVESVVREVSTHAASAGLGDEDMIADKLLERERSHTTVIGAGLAVPHATVPGLSKPVIGLALAREPVVFGPPESEPVRIFFVLLSPPGSEREHVKLLARICRLGRHESLIEKLERTRTEEDIVEVIESVDSQHV